MNTFLTVTDPIAALLGPWSASLTAGAVVLRIALAAVLAAVIGWERSAKRHAAGLRTFLLVGLAAASAMLIDTSLSAAWGQGFPLITAAAVVGAAMISGGSVLFSSRSQIKGLTTSAGLWACGLVGAAAGAGLYTVALAAFAALLGGLSLLPSLERYLKNRSDHFEIHLELSSRASLRDFVDVVRRLGLRIDDIEANPAYLSSGLSVYSVAMTVCGRELKAYKTHREIIQALGTLDYVCHVDEMD